MNLFSSLWIATISSSTFTYIKSPKSKKMYTVSIF